MMLSLPVGMPCSRTSVSTTGTATATSSHPVHATSTIAHRQAGQRDVAAIAAAASAIPTTAMVTRWTVPNMRVEKELASQVVAKARESQSGPRSELRSTKRSIAFVPSPQWPPSLPNQSPPAHSVVQMLSPTRSSPLKYPATSQRGTQTATAVTTVATSVRMKGRILPARRVSTASGSRNSSG